MCEPVSGSAMMTALIAGSTAMTAYGQYQQGQYQKKVGEFNQKMNEYAALDALQRGEKQAQDIQRQAAQIKGTQRTRAAANGLDLSEGTTQRLQDTTDFFSQVDQNTARYNAEKDAWSSRAAGALALSKGQQAAYQGNLQAFSTILNGSSQVASKWK